MTREKNCSALPPFGRRPVGAVDEESDGATAPEANSMPTILSNGPYRLMIALHFPLMILGFILLWRTELDAGRSAIAAVLAVSLVAHSWALVDGIRVLSILVRRLRDGA